MNKFYTKTLIPTPNINWKDLWPNDPADTTDTSPRWKRAVCNTIDLWDQDTYELLKSCQLTPTLIRVFRWRPKQFFDWHIDGDNTAKIKSEFAINWVVEGKGVIQWNSPLKMPEPNKEIAHRVIGTLTGTLADKFEDQTIGHGCIVNTTIPHRVINVESIHRLTISIHFGNQLTYEKAVNRLTDCGLI